MLPDLLDDVNMVDVEKMEPSLENLVYTMQEVQDSESAEQDVRLVPLKWGTITSLLALTGMKRFSGEGYEVFSVFFKMFCKDLNLPSTITLNKTLRPFHRPHAFVKA